VGLVTRVLLLGLGGFVSVARAQLNGFCCVGVAAGAWQSHSAELIQPKPKQPSSRGEAHSAEPMQSIPRSRTQEAKSTKQSPSS